MDLEENELSEPNSINFIPCLKWVKKGVAKANPEKVQLTKEELIQVIKDAKSKLKTTENAEGSAEGSSSMNVENEFDLENYDEDDDETYGLEQLGIQNIMEVPNLEENLTDDDSDNADDIIQPADNLILVGKVEGDASILEVYVYNENEGSLYCHHDLFLPSFPLCIEWLDYEPGNNKGNYCAIGSMSPVIDIWDVDVVNCLEPAYHLGQKASRKKGREHIGHTDAVLDLSWNPSYHHVLASASVDQTILLWDIDEGKPSSKIEVFQEKVQCIKWHKLEAYTLLAGGCDNTVRVFDCRNLESHLSWTIDGEAERICWNPLEPYMFFVGTSNGSVQCIDCRNGPMWSMKAHEKEVTGMSISGQCPGLLVTASTDGMFKVWDFKQENQPALIEERNLKLEGVHCLELCPDSPFVIAAGGDNKMNNFKVLNLTSIEQVEAAFGSRPLIQLEVANDESTN
ncbi:PREDICTED: periodic tryptophan protein 1 homolog [Nicrophorus vespilloides]|uniref:Periodic tryptophan protein 1 homolog n=1 Tax=Nicrophorus vespilloides TaxID=110193 RepID=A0ABM1MXE8_NICVS|nr:PREDICTED: periodic tryptophan protein 1 homolog [Nicrophorus vespilloides]